MLCHRNSENGGGGDGDECSFCYLIAEIQRITCVLRAQPKKALRKLRWSSKRTWSSSLCLTIHDGMPDCKNKKKCQFQCWRPISKTESMQDCRIRALILHPRLEEKPLPLIWNVLLHPCLMKTNPLHLFLLPFVESGGRERGLRIEFSKALKKSHAVKVGWFSSVGWSGFCL